MSNPPEDDANIANLVALAQQPPPYHDKIQNAIHTIEFIPTEIGLFTNLKILELMGNDDDLLLLKGSTLPSEIGYLSHNLEALMLVNLGLSGTI